MGIGDDFRFSYSVQDIIVVSAFIVVALVVAAFAIARQARN